MDPAQTSLPVCFDISRYLTDKYFDIVWGCYLPRGPPKRSPQKSMFFTAQLGVPVGFDISRYLTDEYFEGATPTKVNFFYGST